MSTKGTITQVLGAVVDVQFPADKVPEIYNAIQIDYKVEGKATRLILEVQQHLGNGLVRAVAMLHEGAVWLADNQSSPEARGLTAVFELPRVVDRTVLAPHETARLLPAPAGAAGSSSEPPRDLGHT